MIKITQKEREMRLAFIKVQIDEADDKMQKARVALRNTFTAKQTLVDLLKTAEKEVDKELL